MEISWDIIDVLVIHMVFSARKTHHPLSRRHLKGEPFPDDPRNPRQVGLGAWFHTELKYRIYGKCPWKKSSVGLLFFFSSQGLKPPRIPCETVKAQSLLLIHFFSENVVVKSPQLLGCWSKALHQGSQQLNYLNFGFGGWTSSRFWWRNIEYNDLWWSVCTCLERKIPSTCFILLLIGKRLQTNVYKPCLVVHLLCIEKPHESFHKSILRWLHQVYFQCVIVKSPIFVK